MENPVFRTLLLTTLCLFMIQCNSQTKAPENEQKTGQPPAGNTGPEAAEPAKKSATSPSEEKVKEPTPSEETTQNEAPKDEVEPELEPEKKEKTLTDKAVQLFELGQYEQATSLVEQALVDDPLDSEAHFLLGTFLLASAFPEKDLQVLDRAARSFKAAAKLDAQNEAAVVLEGVALFFRDEPDRAKSVFTSCAAHESLALQGVCRSFLGRLKPLGAEELSAVYAAPLAVQATGDNPDGEMYGIPAQGEAEIFVASKDGLEIARKDNGKSSGTIPLLTALTILEVDGDIAVFKDEASKDPVRHTAWTDEMPLKSCKTNPYACKCHKGKKIYNNGIARILRRPGRGKSIRVPNQDALRYTGQKKTATAMWGPTVFCEAEWTVKEHIKKTAPLSGLVPVHGTSQQIEERLAGLRPLVDHLSPDTIQMLLRQRWSRGMSGSLLPTLFAAWSWTPRSVSYGDGVLTEIYDVGSQTVELRNGQIQDITGSKPLKGDAVPSEVEAEGFDEEMHGEAEAANGSNGNTLEIPGNLLSVTCSSSLDSQKGGPCDGAAAVDGVLEKAWAEAAKGDGVGEWIEFKLPEVGAVHSVELHNGYQKKVADKFGDRWPKNQRIRDVEVSWGGGSKTVTLKDSRDPQSIPLGVETDTIRLTIRSAYSAQYKDTYLSEALIRLERDSDPR